VCECDPELVMEYPGSSVVFKVTSDMDQNVMSEELDFKVLRRNPGQRSQYWGSWVVKTGVMKQ